MERLFFFCSEKLDKVLILCYDLFIKELRRGFMKRIVVDLFFYAILLVIVVALIVFLNNSVPALAFKAIVSLVWMSMLTAWLYTLM
ncbi:hypothetical protein [Enterococcus phage vB_EfaS_Ef7.1]|nr:hypothetical protein [Enterococcus phage vB_EfaS_Ef7.1]